MEQGKQTAALYDFLYKDSNRLASYYAQIFGGHLSSVEQTDSRRDATDKGGKLAFPIVGGEFKLTEDRSSGIKRTSAPHDLNVTDVLAALMADDRIQTNPVAAPHGGLVMSQGTLILIDRHVIELGLAALEAAVKEEKAKRPKERNQDFIRTMTHFGPFFEKLMMPSAFLLRLADETLIAGTIKDDGMEKPISTHYFKHGSGGLSDVYLVGIKESAAPLFTLPNTDFIGVGQQATKILSNMLFPESAIRVTPVAMFRKL